MEIADWERGLADPSILFPPNLILNPNRKVAESPNHRTITRSPDRAITHWTRTHYSARKERAGCTAAARRAGSQQARTATSASAPAVAASVTGSLQVTP